MAMEAADQGNENVDVTFYIELEYDAGVTLEDLRRMRNLLQR